MTNTSKYHKDYAVFRDSYQLVLPLNLEGLISTDESVRLLSHLLEKLDYHSLYQAYSREGRNPAVKPSLMFKILVYAYSQGIYSSRKIEQACRRDINFMWLLAGSKAPDHCTIPRFRTHFLTLAFSPKTAAADPEIAAQRLEEKMQSQGIVPVHGLQSQQAASEDSKRAAEKSSS